MRLEDYHPISELVVPEHIVSKPSFPVFDAHSHWGKLLLGDSYPEQYDTKEVVEKLKEIGIKGMVNLDGFSGAELDKMLAKTEESDGFVKTFGNIDITLLERPDFESYVRRTITESKAKGISGLKFWKIIGLEHKDSTGKYIPPNDPRLQCIWQTAAELDLPVLFHIADPVAFFKTIDNRNERWEELGAHPDWAFNAPELYSFETLMQMQYDLIKSNPNTTFIIAHVGSYSENLGAVAKWLDELPNMNIDIAARIGELGRQPYTSKAFLTKYADRVLFGTDCTPTMSNDVFYTTYRFLETMDEYFPYDDTPDGAQGRWRIYGVGLDDVTLEKIYYKNAERLIK